MNLAERKFAVTPVIRIYANMYKLLVNSVYDQALF